MITSSEASLTALYHYRSLNFSEPLTEEFRLGRCFDFLDNLIEVGSDTFIDFSSIYYRKMDRILCEESITKLKMATWKYTTLLTVKALSNNHPADGGSVLGFE